MNNSSHGSVSLLTTAMRAGAEAFLAVLNGDEGGTQQAPGGSPQPDGPISFDPLHDAPPFTADPRASAPEDQRQLASVVYLGAIGRLNADEGRGATSAEVSEFAKKAGYSGGNSVNGWNSRAGSPRQIENIDGARWLNKSGLGTIREAARKAGVTVVGEFAPVEQAQ